MGVGQPCVQRREADFGPVPEKQEDESVVEKRGIEISCVYHAMPGTRRWPRSTDCVTPRAERRQKSLDLRCSAKGAEKQPFKFYV